MQTIETVIATLAAVLGEPKHGRYNGPPTAEWGVLRGRGPGVDCFVSVGGFVRVALWGALSGRRDGALSVVVCDGHAIDEKGLAAMGARLACDNADSVLGFDHSGPIAVPLDSVVECARIIRRRRVEA